MTAPRIAAVHHVLADGHAAAIAILEGEAAGIARPQVGPVQARQRVA